MFNKAPVCSLHSTPLLSRLQYGTSIANRTYRDLHSSLPTKKQATRKRQRCHRNLHTRAAELVSPHLTHSWLEEVSKGRSSEGVSTTVSPGRAHWQAGPRPPAGRAKSITHDHERTDCLREKHNQISEKKSRLFRDPSPNPNPDHQPRPSEPIPYFTP